MRFHGFVLLVAGFVSSGGGTPIGITSIVSRNAPVPPRPTSQHGASTNRMLRLYSPAEEEKRATIDKLKGIIESGISVFKPHKDLRKWLKEGDEVLESLKLNKGVGSILTNPNLEKLDNYVSMLKDKFPKRELTTEMAVKRQGQQNRFWLDKEETPIAIFKRLKLDDKAVYPLSGDTLLAWRYYLDVFNKRNPNAKVSELSVFRKIYGDRGLATMFLNANGSQELRARANVLQRTQFKAWSEARVKSNQVLTTVFKLDVSKATSSDNMVEEIYKTWLRKTHRN
ncbi:unnamed protein product [Phytophthora fragariaefolia]|uniref:Unnamed protein product n=1 Tax=Phytophthora fragariaefolia TaxID=1490495 RepID=A0A9W6TK47_9STRA|nr:unnamed protein product [Phytophthora fragariaefolia]